MSGQDGHVDTLVLTWTFGIILAYAAIIAFVSWMTFQSILLIQAYFATSTSQSGISVSGSY